MKLQDLNELITSTNYCGPGTSSKRPATSLLDRACKRHDAMYSGLKRPYTQYNDADEMFLRSIKKVKPVTVREIITKKAAQVIFGTKRSLASRGILSTEVQSKKSKRIMPNVRNQRKKTRFRRKKKVVKATKRRSAKSRSRGGRIRKYSRGGRKNVGPSFVRKLDRIRDEMKPPVKVLRMFKGNITHPGKITYTYWRVADLQWKDETAMLDIFDKLYGGHTDYHSAIASRVYEFDITNVGNIPVVLKVFTARAKPHQKGGDMFAPYNENFANAMILDAANNTAVSNTFGERWDNYDMSQAMADTGASGGASGIWTSAYVYNSDHKLSYFETAVKNYKINVLFEVIIKPGDVYKHVTAPYKWKPSNLQSWGLPSATSKAFRHLDFMFQLSTFPYNYTTTSDSFHYPPCRTAVSVKCHDKYRPVGNQVDESLIRPIVYTAGSSGTSVAENFDVYTQVAPIQVDDNA